MVEVGVCDVMDVSDEVVLVVSVVEVMDVYVDGAIVVGDLEVGAAVVGELVVGLADVGASVVRGVGDSVSWHAVGTPSIGSKPRRH